MEVEDERDAGFVSDHDVPFVGLRPSWRDVGDPIVRTQFSKSVFDGRGRNEQVDVGRWTRSRIVVPASHTLALQHDCGDPRPLERSHDPGLMSVHDLLASPEPNGGRQRSGAERRATFDRSCADQTMTGQCVDAPRPGVDVAG